MDTMNNNFKQTQKVVAKLIENSVTKNRLSHALLVVGPHGFQSDQAIDYLALHILCEHKTACQECIPCRRYLNKTYSDMVVLDGHNQKILKEDIELIKVQFSKTALEKNNKRLYILKNFDKSTPSATNALLKFLEEPQSDIYAIIHCENANQILETIISRCQVFNLKPQPLISSNLDVMMLSNIYDDMSYIQSIIAIDEYEELKKAVMKVINTLYTKPDQALLIMQVNFSKYLKEFDQILFDLLLAYHLDRLRNHQTKINIECSQSVLVKNIDIIIRNKQKLKNNVNKPLLFDALFIELGAK